MLAESVKMCLADKTGEKQVATELRATRDKQKREGKQDMTANTEQKGET